MPPDRRHRLLRRGRLDDRHELDSSRCELGARIRIDEFGAFEERPEGRVEERFAARDVDLPASVRTASSNVT